MVEPSSSSKTLTATAVIGAGTIGRAFALLFAAAGCSVRLYDPDLGQRENAKLFIEKGLADLAEFDLLDEPPLAILARIVVASSVEETSRDAEFIQECAPEKEEVKRALFEQIDRSAPADAVIASASSAMPASKFASGLPGSGRCLVAHPGNPPFLLRVVEIVPAPFTAAETVERTVAFFEQVGLQPILVRKEIEGFVFNRLQGAVLREAYCLVRDGVASVEEIDRIVRDGLGLRWSVVGPFESVDLNTVGGIDEHAKRLGGAYARMGAERGQQDPWTSDLVSEVVAQRRALLPLERWRERAAWRDRALMRLLRCRRDVATADQPEVETKGPSLPRLLPLDPAPIRAS